ncbi:MAG: CotH kinase family protein [Chloroflexota bacterium]
MKHTRRARVPLTHTLLCGGLAVLLAACGPVQSLTGSGSQPASPTSTTVDAPANAAARPAGKTDAKAEARTKDKTSVARPAGWAESSHGNDARPNYEVVFPKDRVNQLTITISPESWSAMQANMTALFGERGSRPMGGPPPGGQFGNGQGQPPEPPQGGFPGGPPGGAPGGPDGPPGRMVTKSPDWVAATVELNGKTWTNVGVRYKGNSSLMSSWGSGSPKLPLKLDFDKLEDAHPEIKNQRFYGFDQLSLGNNFSDATNMRDTVAYGLLAKAGLPAARTAFYEVLVDHGEGPVSLGIYTAVEVIDDTVVKREFGSDSGNIYEADGRAASLAQGTADQIAETFQKENNKDADWSDVQRLYDVLHSPKRTSDPAAWRKELESVFAVDGFLKWLALSGVMQHWDTYGGMTHNYYLYHDPATDRLTWISWDHNMILSEGGPGGFAGQNGPGGPGGPGAAAGPGGPGAAAGPGGPGGGVGQGGSIAPGGAAGPGASGGQGGFRGPARGAGGLGGGAGQGAVPAAKPKAPMADGQRGGMGPGRGVTLDRQDVTDRWPLIRFLLDDPTYQERYVGYVGQVANQVFVPDQLAAEYQRMAALLAPYADKAGTRAELDRAVQALTDKTTERAKAAADYLATARQPR